MLPLWALVLPAHVASRCLNPVEDVIRDSFVLMIEMLLARLSRYRSIIIVVWFVLVGYSPDLG